VLAFIVPAECRYSVPNDVGGGFVSRIAAIEGNSRTWVSKVRGIGGRLARVDGKSRARANAENVVRYMLKAGKTETGGRLGLSRSGEGGQIIGKRCGRTQNLAQSLGVRQAGAK